MKWKLLFQVWVISIHHIHAKKEQLFNFFVAVKIKQYINACFIQNIIALHLYAWSRNGILFILFYVLIKIFLNHKISWFLLFSSISLSLSSIVHKSYLAVWLEYVKWNKFFGEHCNSPYVFYNPVEDCFILKP